MLSRSLKWLAVTAGELPPVPVPVTDEREELMKLAARHGVLPAVARRLEESGGQELIQLMGRTMMLRLRLEEIQRGLREDGVPFVVLKGAEFADRLYPDPSLRGFTDIDLLMPRVAVEASGETLRRLGYEVKTIKDLRHAEPYGEQLWQPVGRPKFGVEVHWNLVNSPAVQRGVSVQFEDLQRDEAGRLSAASLLLIAAVHGAVSHQFDRLQLLCDVRQAASGVAGKLDEAYLASVAVRTGSRLALVTALGLGERMWNDTECGRLRRAMPVRAVDGVASWLITPRLVLEMDAKTGSLRRRLFRELLKRR